MLLSFCPKQWCVFILYLKLIEKYWSLSTNLSILFEYSLGLRQLDSKIDKKESSPGHKVERKYQNF